MLLIVAGLAWLSHQGKHLEENPSSLLCRVYGCFSFKNSLGYFLHAVLMDCLVGLPASIADIAGFDCLTPSIFDMKSEWLGFNDRSGVARLRVFQTPSLSILYLLTYGHGSKFTRHVFQSSFS